MLLGLLLVWAVLIGIGNRRRSATASARPQVRRDVIADGTVRERDVDEMLAAENARLRAAGRAELKRGELEARVVGDSSTRRRLLRLRRRRHPERARPPA